MIFPIQIWLVDFEFHQPDGEVPRPICMLARNLATGETIRNWLWDGAPGRCPIPLGPDVLYVAYMASAELGCHLALNWPLPVNVLDLSAEFRRHTSGRTLSIGRSLLGALSYFGINGIDATKKQELRHLAIRGGSYTRGEAKALLDYCETDVVALAKLLPVMWHHLDLPRALIRGRYMKAVSRIERNGIPIAIGELELLRERWDSIQCTLVARVDRTYGVYEGASFRRHKFLAYCGRENIRWPMLESGQPNLKNEVFRQMARIYPQLLPLYDLKSTLGRMRLNGLTVSRDGRNRYLTGTFGSKTGRNQPSSAKSIFGPSRWIRHLIQPDPRMALAYIDYSQQEFGIAAALSGDNAMKDAYRSGDPYLQFAKLAGAVPSNATKESHPEIRDQYKIAALGILMGMGSEQLGIQTKTCGAMGRRLLRQHKEVFPRYWEWSDSQVDRAKLGERLTSVYGWELRSVDESSTTLRNFKLQANGADMLRLAAIALTERHIRVCALVHDAVLIEASIDQIEAQVTTARRLMKAAARALLGGFEIETEVEIARHPDRFRDKRGRELWETVCELAGLQLGEPAQFDHAAPSN
ncbi:MAG: DNA polymerase I [Verrucomicrobiae bacterium]|nr:DNA polymerase I [Verrucomicrobiae bacterium]